MAKQGDFFHSGTESKLKAISGYLASYQKVLSKFRAHPGNRTVYFDGFAGTGDLPIGIDDGGLLHDVEDLAAIAEGSARRALAVVPWFDEYFFVERSRGKAVELAKLKVEFSDRADRIHTIRGEANAETLVFCRKTDWRRTRAVVFLDPFGNQVNWETITEIARRPIDLWYLFPAHLGVNRQISNAGVVDDPNAASLDRVYGTTEWRNKFLVRETVRELDGSEREQVRKQLNADIATQFMIDRMKGVFRGGVVDSWLPLGKNGRHWYSLVFAWGNPNQRASEIAQRIATHIMTRKWDGRPL
jgi:three-Cys-motif partner protein